MHASREVTVFWSNKVEHILDNLISNSLKYGSAEKPIIVSAYKHGATVEILLTDSGPGIQDSVMNGLFRPDMQRTGSARSGRGLYLASEQADEIGGRLTYLRNEESGSTFSLDPSLLIEPFLAAGQQAALYCRTSDDDLGELVLSFKPNAVSRPERRAVAAGLTNALARHRSSGRVRPALGRAH